MNPAEGAAGRGAGKRVSPKSIYTKSKKRNEERGWAVDPRKQE